jgi:hypothetical protein
MDRWEWRLPMLAPQTDSGGNPVILGEGGGMRRPGRSFEWCCDEMGLK